MGSLLKDSQLQDDDGRFFEKHSIVFFSDGRLVPKDSNVLINLYAVNRDKSIWGPDAEEFNAGRFLSVTKDQQARGANSFGIGARSCPGEKMAQADMFYTVVRILQKLELSCVNGPGTAVLYKNVSDIFLDAPRQPLIFRRYVKV